MLCCSDEPDDEARQPWKPDAAFVENDFNSQVFTPLQALLSSTVTGSINLQNDHKTTAKIVTNEPKESDVERPQQSVLGTTRSFAKISSETSHECSNNFSPSQQEQEKMELNVPYMQRNTDTFSNTASNRSSNVPSVVTYSQSSSQHLVVKLKTFKSSSVTTGTCVCVCRAI